MSPPAVTFSAVICTNSSSNLFLCMMGNAVPGETAGVSAPKLPLTLRVSTLSFLLQRLPLRIQDVGMFLKPSISCIRNEQPLQESSILLEEYGFFSAARKMSEIIHKKLAATSLECKQAGTFQYTSVCVGGRFRLITRIREKN